MKKTVVLAEKPSVARDIARVLKCNKKGNGYLEGDQYVVTWALGHLVTLADPETYDDKYKQWRLEDLPMLPPELKLIVIKQSGKQYQAVKSQLTRKDVGEIVIATDAGREGELVARWIIEKSGVRKPLKRLWISSVTDKAIKDGFKQLKDGKAYERLYFAAVARAEADWIVGMNATRALTTKFNAQLSAGRVQTPTVAMVAARENEIRTFVPREFYGIQVATTNGLTLTWRHGKTNEARTFDEAERNALLTKMKTEAVRVKTVERKAKKSYAPGLYNLTELQKDAHRLYGYSAKETLSIMQRLYEQYKVLTYPRTDSRYLSSDIVPTLVERIKAHQQKPYGKIAMKILQGGIKVSKSFVDDSKVSDHHAIIPTEESVILTSLSDKERKIYDLVLQRFFAVLYPPFEYEQTTIHGTIAGEKVVASGKVVKNLGWKEVYEWSDDEEEDDNDTLVPVAEGDTLTVKTFQATTGETKPPAPFNEGTLLGAMENPAKFIAGSDKKLVQTLGRTGGIGTVATRADIIEKLFNNFLIEKRGKDIFVTSKGRQLLDLVPEDLRSPALTAEWELKLEAIEKGQLPKEQFLTEIRAYAKQVVHEVKNSAQKYRHDNMTGTKCPQCQKFLLSVNGKHGKMLVCQDRECGYKKTLAKVTNARCPQCKKKLELRGEGEGQTFACGCGYREKLSAFNARRDKEKQGKVSKRDIQKYLKQQNDDDDDEPFNNPFAALLKRD